MNLEEKKEFYLKKKKYLSSSPLPPPYIYKYCPINNDLWKNILNNQIWVSNPTEFNDPFDCKLQILPFENEKEKRILVEKLIEWEAIQQKDKKKFLESDIEEFNSIIESLINVHNSMGIACFCIDKKHKRNENLLLWSHYADSHKGVRLKFDILDDILYMFELKYLRNPILNLRKVNYIKEYLILNYIKDSVDLSIKLLSTKSECWDYENEARIISQKSGPVKFRKKALSEIVFGCKLKPTDDDVKDIIKLVKSCNYPNVKFIQTIKCKDRFALEFKEMNV
jgi:hypothetical protein